jgi:hypothetical protein
MVNIPMFPHSSHGEESVRKKIDDEVVNVYRILICESGFS